MTTSIVQGDAVEWARNYQGEPFHALLCDPPYHLTSIVKRFGSEDAAPTQGGVYARSSAGFMGKVWDGGDVAFQPETWAAFLKIMYPGAFLMAFASSRGWHRLACAIEDGGWIIHPSIFGWLYGSGFPKATRVNHGHPKTETFEGHRYGLQALKPALEPIIVAQRPYEGKPIDCITDTGSGVLNIDAGRIGYEEGGTLASNPSLRDHINAGNGGNIISHEDNRRVVIPDQAGRWPANFLLLDDEAAAALDRQSGELNGDSRNRKPRHATKNNWKFFAQDDSTPGIESAGFSDSGGASRFFFRVSEQLDAADPVRYQAKASRSERDAGLEELPETSKQGVRPNSPDPTGKFPDHDQRDGVRNPHPTVKPLALTKYLATLLLPPAEYSPRRLFVPFAGVASECIGAMQAGWDEVVGVELTEEYLPIANARIEYWAKQGVQITMELD